MLQDGCKKQALQQAAFLMKTFSRKCPRKFVHWTVFVKSLNAGSPNLKKWTVVVVAEVAVSSSDQGDRGPMFESPLGGCFFFLFPFLP